MITKWWKILLAVCLTTLTAAGILGAAELPDLNAAQLKAKISSGEKIFLLDPLSDIEFNEGHIPGSINIPLHLIKTTDKLPSEKATPIVTYCLGPK